MRSWLVSLIDFLFVLLVITVGILLIYVASTTTSLQVLVNGVPLELPDVKALGAEVYDFLQATGDAPEQAAGLESAEEVETEVLDFTRIEKTNLVDNLPVPTPLPSPTPVPDPIYYRNEVILRVKHFASTLEGFFEQNEKLRGKPDLLHDAEWLRETRIRLDAFSLAAWELGKVPVPAEYQTLQEKLESVGPHAQNLRDQYLLGVEQKSQDNMRTAGAELDLIYEAMAQVQAEMVKVGWQQ